MVHRICLRALGEDTRALVRLSKIRRLFPQLRPEGLFLVDNYTIVKNLSPDALMKAAGMLTQPVIEESAVDRPLLPGEFSWSFEIGFLPGVTDNTGHTAKESIGDLLNVKFEPDEDVYSSQTTFLAGTFSLEDVKAIAALFYNPLIHHVEILSREEWEDGNRAPYAPLVTLPPPADVIDIDLELPEEEDTSQDEPA